MEMKKATMFAFLLALLLLLAAQESVPRVEAMICRLPSARFGGPCTSDKTCAVVCKSEGFDGGDCEGYSMGCLCNNRC